MADTEFEEFRINFDRLPQNSKVLVPFYSLVPDILEDEDSPTSSKSDGGTDGESVGPGPPSGPSSLGMGSMGSLGPSSLNSLGPSSLNSMGAQPAEYSEPSPENIPYDPGRGGSFIHWNGTGTGERKRRKLPEIPKNKKSTVATLYNINPLSLAAELGALTHLPHHAFTMQSCYLRDDSSSPDSERLPTDVDSGHSTAHSPTEGRSMSPLGLGGISPLAAMSASMSSSICRLGGGVPASHCELLEPTHRGLHKFIPRHEDEIELEIGDPIYVQKESEDLWCEGVNLRTGRLGIFPSAYAVDQELSAWESEGGEAGSRRERYQLGYLGSVECLAHKGTSVVCQAVKKVTVNGEPAPTSCILEISDQGLRMVDRSKRNKDQPCIDYFYSLKNVSFCAFHPRDHRYLGFITKHPTLQRFACHVFRGRDSTRPVAESVGRAFQRFYQKFIETAYPIEDIYIE